MIRLVESVSTGRLSGRLTPQGVKSAAHVAGFDAFACYHDTADVLYRATVRHSAVCCFCSDVSKAAGFAEKLQFGYIFDIKILQLCCITVIESGHKSVTGFFACSKTAGPSVFQIEGMTQNGLSVRL